MSNCNSGAKAPKDEIDMFQIAKNLKMEIDPF
jgi:hypothetical protein